MPKANQKPNKYYQTYPAWKREVKKIGKKHDVTPDFKGDKDIDSCYIQGHIYAEWGGGSGVIEQLEAGGH